MTNHDFKRHVIDEVFSTNRGEDFAFDRLEKLIDRYYLPRPLFEDGKPVQWNDKCRCEDGETLWLSDVQLGYDGTYKLTGYDGVEEHHSFFCMAGERVKRPEPEVLDADGVPIHVGDVVYSVQTGNCYTVRKVRPDKQRVEFVDHVDKGWWPYLFTHKQPDSLKRVIEDMTDCIAKWSQLTPSSMDREIVFERIRDRLCELDRRQQ